MRARELERCSIRISELTLRTMSDGRVQRQILPIPAVFIDRHGGQKTRAFPDGRVEKSVLIHPMEPEKPYWTGWNDRGPNGPVLQFMPEKVSFWSYCTLLMESKQRLIGARWKDHGRVHFIEMSGMRGYMPDNCGACETWDGAVDSLVDLFELGSRRERELRYYGWLDLHTDSNPPLWESDGAEYCQVTICGCDDPMQHEDGYDQYRKHDWQELGYYGGVEEEE